MKNATQVYVLRLNAPLRKTMHCSSKMIDRTLAEMQQPVGNLQRTIIELATGGSYSINRSR
jgi:hypothetical protein